MALVTGLNELSARDEIKKSLHQGYLRDIRDTFLRYLLKIDNGRLEIPRNAIYAQIQVAQSQIKNLTAPGWRQKEGYLSIFH
jgi:transcriptional regulator CtsR